jgi:hypothetical protein
MANKKIPRKPATKPSKKKTENNVSPMNNPYIPIFFLLLILGVFSFIRIRLLSFPLERDEGEYAYFGQLILNGVPPYKLAYNLKLPGTYYSYALIMSIFGQTTEGIRMGLLLFNLGSLIFLYFITKKLFNPFMAIIATATAAVLFISPGVCGQAAHATQFVTFWMLAGTFFLITGFEKKKIWYFLISGVMMGLSFIMKQSALFFPLFGACMIILWFFVMKQETLLRSLANLSVYTGGVILTFAALCLLMSASGVFEKFWFWTIIYPQSYGSRTPSENILPNLSMAMTQMTSRMMILYITSLLGIVALIIYRGQKWSRILIALLLVFSLLNVIPGFYFRVHYFIPLIPVMGILTALLFDTLNVLSGKYFRQIRVVTGITFAILMFITLNANSRSFFKSDVEILCKRLYGKNPFNESIPVAKFIKANTADTDKIFVLGSEPQIYFYSQRRSATGYIYMYDLAYKNSHVWDMQKEMFSEVEKSHPKYVVYVSCRYSWLGQKTESDSISVWANRYFKRVKFRVAGLIDIPDKAPAIYTWGEDAFKYKPKSANFIRILQRID